ncbi:corrinoid adenosyltransferase MMAB-like [Cylas formicarius]|uniref:corrinoid adenosyltransferase MMAB-like n=1 Tax=Cylas formicarius TaxID=197179 RepID=UPI002958BFBF|nr:corrinoid adenosyltransferase MMAB-like [Cylas formicarius]
MVRDPRAVHLFYLSRLFKILINNICQIMDFRKILLARNLNQIRHYCSKRRKETLPEKSPFKNMQMFSRDGDNGTSKLLSGEILPKDHQMFVAIGATEELLSYIGLAREYAYESEQLYTDKLKRIQTIVIDISTAISRNNKVTILPIYTKELEDWIQEYAKQLSPPEQHIIPGGGIASASLHVARAICRKTERVVLPLVREEKLDKEAAVYLNRLSDFLFTVSRIAAKHDQRNENIYIPKPDEKIQAQ